jgi:hypothetical protein
MSFLHRAANGEEWRCNTSNAWTEGLNGHADWYIVYITIRTRSVQYLFVYSCNITASQKRSQWEVGRIRDGLSRSAALRFGVWRELEER